MEKFKRVAEILKERGYEAEVKSEFNNKGITIILGDESIQTCRTCFYKNMFKDDMSAELVADYIIEWDKSNENKPSEADVAFMLDWFKAKSKLVLCIRKKTKDNTVTKEFDNRLEFYVRIKLGNDMTARINSNILKTWDISKEELFNSASENSDLEFKPITELIMMPEFKMPTIVITNKDYYFGAAEGFLSKNIEYVMKRYGMKEGCWVFPSSIHEVIICPFEELTKDTAIDVFINGLMFTNSNEILCRTLYKYSDGFYPVADV